jgi:hypothetical protein
VRRTHQVAIASLVLAFIATFTTTAASAATKHWTVEIAPVFFQNMTGDASGGPGNPYPFPGFNAKFPRTTSDLRLDYGITYAFSPKLSLGYSHENVDFSLGRLSAFDGSLLTGDIQDRVDTVTATYAGLRVGLPISVYYQSHQRINVEGLCLNQEACFGTSNPASINETVYGIGTKYNFGPLSPYTGPLFTVGVDAQYTPRLPAQSAASCPTSSAPVCNANGLPGYVGSGWQFPYSITMRPPLGNTLGFIPFVGYQRASVWWRSENTPEAFNVVVWGIVKVLHPGLVLSYTNLKFNGCYCSDTLPPPDSVRFQDSIFKLSYDLKF